MWPSAAIVHLDEVEAQVAEEEAAVLLVVAIESHAHAYGVGIVDAAAGVAPRITIDARFQPQTVDMFHHRLQTFRKAGGVDE